MKADTTHLEQLVDQCPSGRNCGNFAASEPHPCPYAEDVGNDSESLCNCCYDCAAECAFDI